MANPGNAGGTGDWIQIVTAKSIPSTDFSIGEVQDVNELIAYSSTILYMNYKGRIYVSTNSGSTHGTGFTQDNLGSAQTYSDLIAVDPQNADFVFPGSAANGLLFTTNGTSVSAVLLICESAV
jgi:hypothetical protein